jgi:SOS-response transcriptional repressor LexA
MQKLSRKSKVSVRPEWAKKVSGFRERLRLSQTEFAHRLQSSAMAVSRWERGVQEPPSNIYVAMGNLAGDPECWYFWGQAGLHREDLMRVLPILERQFQSARSSDIEMVTAGSGVKKHLKKAHLVAVPLLKVVAASHGDKGDDMLALHNAPVDSMIAAPSEWCPNPLSTTCLRVKGHSMEPAICDGDIMAVDSSQTDVAKLDGKIVIAWNKEKGLTVSRLKRYDHTEVLQSDNPHYESITLSGRKKWKVVAKALWWIRKAA